MGGTIKVGITGFGGMRNKLSQPANTDGNKGTIDGLLVSIITPVLNGVKYLEDCIQSVLSQTYPHIEHIFIDGGSTDGTLEMLRSYQAKYPERIRVISEPDRSAGEAWNKGLRMAKGEIFGWLGSDDIYEPDTIQTVMEFFRKNPDAYFVFGGCNFINEKGEIIGKAQIKDFDLKEAINDTCYIPCPSAFYRREIIKKVGSMDTTINACDLDYWIRVGKVFQIHRIEKLLSNFRLHKDSVSGSKEAGKMYALEGYIISRRHGGRIFSPRARLYFMSVILDRLGLYYFALFVVAKLRRYPFINKVLRMLGV
jgi:glycosyltransferase involved in cell wall biosynthesis